jgi:gas vesicle protein
MTNGIEKRSFGMNGTRNVLIGLLIGGLAGATTMLLLAPRSGKETRAQIQSKGIQLRDRTTGAVKDVLAQVRSDTREVASGLRGKAGHLKQVGKDKLVEQMDRVSAALDAGKAAVEAA